MDGVCGRADGGSGGIGKRGGRQRTDGSAGHPELVVVDVVVVVVEGGDSAPVVGLLAQLFAGIWAGNNVVRDVDVGKWPGLGGGCACSAWLAFRGRAVLEAGALKLYGAVAVDGTRDAEPTAPFLWDVGVDNIKARGVAPARAVVARYREPVVVCEPADALNSVLVIVRALQRHDLVVDHGLCTATQYRLLSVPSIPCPATHHKSSTTSVPSLHNTLTPSSSNSAQSSPSSSHSGT